MARQGKRVPGQGAWCFRVARSSTCRQGRSCCLPPTRVRPHTASSALFLGTKVEDMPQRRPLPSPIPELRNSFPERLRRASLALIALR